MLVPTKHICGSCKKVYETSNVASIWCPECRAKNLAAIRKITAKLQKKVTILVKGGRDERET